MVFVTGGNGFVGSYLVCDLLKQGKQVRAMLRKGSSLSAFDAVAAKQLGSQKDNLLKKLEWVEGDITDVTLLPELLQGMKQVYHCAALVSFQTRDRDRLFKINTEGTANVVNACLAEGIEKLCHASSVAAIGRATANADISEETDWVDSPENSNYAISKHLGEMEVWRGIEEGLKAVIVNPGIILGFGEWNSGSCELFKQAYKGIPAVTEGTNGYVDVRDVSRIMTELMDSDISGERFVLVSENQSYKNIFGLTAEKFGKKPTRLIATPWMSELAWRLIWPKTLFGKKAFISKETARNSQSKYRYNNSKIKKFLNTEFIPVERAISEACETFKDVKVLS